MAEEMADEFYDYEEMYEKVFEELSRREIKTLAGKADVPADELDDIDAEDLQEHLEKEGLVSEKDVTWLMKTLKQMGKDKAEQIVYNFKMFSLLGRLTEILDENLSLADMKRLARDAKLPASDVNDIEDADDLLGLIADKKLIVTRNITWIIFAVRNNKDITGEGVLPALLKYQGNIRLSSFTGSMEIYFSKEDAIQLARNAKFGEKYMDIVKSNGMGGIKDFMTDNKLGTQWILNLVENSTGIAESARATKALKLFIEEYTKTREAQNQVEEGMKRLTLS